MIDDSGNDEAKVGTINHTLITGFGMGGEIDYGSFEDAAIQFGQGNDSITIVGNQQLMSEINTGNGDDVVNIESITSETIIKLGQGNDIVNVANLNKQVDDIAAALIVSGGIGDDILNIDDSGDKHDNTAILYDTLIVGLGMNGEIDYGSFEQLNISFGSGNNILSIESTYQATTNISTGIGSDMVHVENIYATTNFKESKNMGSHVQ